jgi:hypothetical protein
MEALAGEQHGMSKPVKKRTPVLETREDDLSSYKRGAPSGIRIDSLKVRKRGLELLRLRQLNGDRPRLPLRDPKPSAPGEETAP